MIKVAQDWNPKQALLKELLKDKSKFREAINHCLSMHAYLHNSKVSNSNFKTYEDALLENIPIDSLKEVDKKKYFSIAYNLWHITRIEDICANILIANDKQILTNEIREKTNSNISHTGNSLSFESHLEFCEKINIDELLKYRLQVGKKTREIIQNIKPGELKRKMLNSQLKRILDEGTVADHEDAIWLLDFWGKKNTAGLLLMPITRHQIIHLNDAFRLKKKFI